MIGSGPQTLAGSESVRATSPPRVLSTIRRSAAPASPAATAGAPAAVGAAATTIALLAAETEVSAGHPTIAPSTVGFSAGQGRVLDTSFHQEPGVDSAAEQLLRFLMFEL